MITFHWSTTHKKVFTTKGVSSLSLRGNLGHLSWVRHSSYKSSATHCSQCVQWFCVSNNAIAGSAWDFNTCTDVDESDCTWGLYKHHKRVGTRSRLGENWGLEPASILHLAFQLDALHTVIPPLPPLLTASTHTHPDQQPSRRNTWAKRNLN